MSAELEIQKLRKELGIDDYLELVKEDRNCNGAYVSFGQYMYLLEQENQELKKQLEYLRSGEYLNQLKLERNMLEDVVNKGEVSKEDKEFIDMTHRNTELLEQQKEFIEWLELMYKETQDIWYIKILNKYKEIIGKGINVGTKEVKNDD